MDIKDLKEKLNQAYFILKEAVDISAEIKGKDAEKNDEVNQSWEIFITWFFSYVKHKGKETGVNLMSGLSLFRLLK